jgi:hypothetical protein
MLENCAKTSGCQLVARIKSKEGMRVLEGVLVGYEEMTMREWDVMDRGLGWGKGRSVGVTHCYSISPECHIKMMGGC